MASNIISEAVRISSAMGPSVRNLLAHYKLDPSQIVSTGPHRTLLKSDVLSFMNQKNLQPGQGSSLPSKRQAIAHALPKYARKHLTQLEIDVINNGGRL